MNKIINIYISGLAGMVHGYLFMAKKKILLMPWNELQCVVLSIAKEYVQRTTYNPSINGNKCSGDRNRIAPTKYKAAKNGKKY